MPVAKIAARKQQQCIAAGKWEQQKVLDAAKARKRARAGPKIKKQPTKRTVFTQQKETKPHKAKKVDEDSA